MKDADWQADLARYPKRPWLREQSVWAVALYRWGRRADRRRAGPLKWLFNRVYWLAHFVVETLTGVTLPKTVSVGPGLRIWHFGNVIIHSDSVIGARCDLRHGVTLGSRHDDGPAPTLGDDVSVGAYAQILGGVRVGDGAKIGAMSVVLRDVPAGATAVGNPARIIDPAGGGPPEPALANGRPGRAGLTGDGL